MDFQPKAAQRQKRRRKLDPTLEQPEYSQWLQFYQIPPTETISLQELEELALNRLKVLKAVETVGVRHIRGSTEHHEALEQELRKLAKDEIMKGLIPRRIYTEEDEENLESVEERRKDHLSHFILRLAYCKTEDLRRWFITQESDLFRYRFCGQSATGAKQFLEFNKLNYVPISKTEKEQLRDKILCSRPNFTEAEFESTEFYKVYFTDVLELVRSCRVYLHKGFAFVPHADLVVVILSIFRTKLSHDLAIASRYLPNIEEEDRLLPLLSDISKQCNVGDEYGAGKVKTGSVTCDMLDSLSKSAYPLCMQHLHQNLRQNHHLKYHGRMQYGLFLKGIGLSLESALQFWQMEFSRIMDSDKFQKQYAYNIRHSYGKEGKRADYTPYSCMKIIMGNPPAVGDHHGCPYRHWDIEILKQRLQALRLSGAGAEEVLDLTKQGHYQLACGRFFEIKNNVDWKFSPQHPNQYYDASSSLGGVAADSSGGKVVLIKSQPATSANVPASSTNVDSSQMVQKTQPGDDFDDDFDFEQMDETCLEF